MKIHYFFTAITDDMMMLEHLGLKMGLTVNGLDFFYQVMLFKGGQGAIHRIQGKGGHAYL